MSRKSKKFAVDMSVHTHHNHEDGPHSHGEGHDHDGHDHDHHEGGDHGADVVKDLWIAFVLNLVFTVAEFIGGFFSNSMAIMTDAVHDLGDTLGIGSALFFEKYSTRGRDAHYSYGYRRYSSMAAFVNCIILTAGSVVMISRSVPALFHPEEVKPDIMLGMAIAGLLFNGLAVLKLRHGHTHGGHSHNRNTVMLHLMEDLLGWIAVLVGSIVIRYTGWHILDPILSLVIALYIMFNAIKGLRATGKILLQAVPDQTKIASLEVQIKALEGVENIHDLHLWTLDGNYDVLTVHIKPVAAAGLAERKRIQQEAETLIRRQKIRHYTIQMDWDEGCAFGDC